MLFVAHPNDTVTAIESPRTPSSQTLQTDPNPEPQARPVWPSVGNTFYLTDSTDNVLRTVTFQDVAATPSATSVSRLPAGIQTLDG